MDKSLIEQVAAIIGLENIKHNEPLKHHTSFRIGGPADCLLLPKSAEALAKVIQLLKSRQAQYLIIGNGSNLLVKDKGIRGFVIKMEPLSDYVVEGEVIHAHAGILLSSLSKVAYRHGLTGLEFASGIPGTLGGAVYMNAGAYGGEISQVLTETRYVTQEGTIETIMGEAHGFGYRCSIFQANQGIIVSSRLQLKMGDKEEILRQMQDLNEKRRDKQPLEWPSAGSTFKRPPGYYAGKLIMDAGLRGKRIGGAMVSEKHCGFVVNMGDATAQDVLDLMAYIKEQVYQQFGVELDPEIKILGE